MDKLTKGEFVEVEYTGRLKEDNSVFDTTDEKTAKDNKLYSQKHEYGPVTICLGEHQLLAGLEKELEGKELNKEYTFTLSPENAFGKKDAKLVRMIPYRAFKKQNLEPQPGMQVDIDGMMGIIRTATGGRCLVDFNHPLSGKEVVYTIKANKIITDDAEKVNAYLKLAIGLKSEVAVKEGNAEVKIEKELPKEIHEALEKSIIEVVPSLKKISFIHEKKAEEKKPKQ